ncbi:unnamed protein product [Protopolystoma xenopodis]|uniref:Uncharacterized protein n=1 Tax=Protopolystoma xenopodis TaxID=117903 RepID=A0A3S5FG48_9PLAT|nr:unnamed protein product [Protopolystoma xenopodis]
MSPSSDNVRHVMNEGSAVFAQNVGECNVVCINLNVVLKPIGCSTTRISRHLLASLIYESPHNVLPYEMKFISSKLESTAVSNSLELVSSVAPTERGTGSYKHSATWPQLQASHRPDATSKAGQTSPNSLLCANFVA